MVLTLASRFSYSIAGRPKGGLSKVCDYIARLLYENFTILDVCQKLSLNLQRLVTWITKGLVSFCQDWKTYIIASRSEITATSVPVSIWNLASVPCNWSFTNQGLACPSSEDTVPRNPSSKSTSSSRSSLLTCKLSVQCLWLSYCISYILIKSALSSQVSTNCISCCTMLMIMFQWFTTPGTGWSMTVVVAFGRVWNCGLLVEVSLLWIVPIGGYQFVHLLSWDVAV